MVTKGGRGVPNIYGIDEIRIHRLLPIPFYCEFGKDSYLVTIDVTFIPGKCHPDYDDIIAEWMTWYGKEIPVEGVCELVFQQFMKYAPLGLEVQVHNEQGVCPTIIKRFPSNRHFELIDPKKALGADLEQLGS